MPESSGSSTINAYPTKVIYSRANCYSNFTRIRRDVESLWYAAGFCTRVHCPYTNAPFVFDGHPVNSERGIGRRSALFRIGAEISMKKPRRLSGSLLSALQSRSILLGEYSSQSRAVERLPQEFPEHLGYSTPQRIRIQREQAQEIPGVLYHIAPDVVLRPIARFPC